MVLSIAVGVSIGCGPLLAANDFSLGDIFAYTL